MQLIQILLPLRDNAGQPYEKALFETINATLVGAFGGVTAFSRSPAQGTWINANREERDDVFVVEVMAERLDKRWWKAFRRQWEVQLNQAEIVVRAHRITRL